MDNQNTSLPASDTENFAFESLEAIRTRLLDLTGRNRLLNFKHGRSGFVRVIDELPDQLAQELLEDKSFMFVPVEEPRKEELVEAGYIGLDEEKCEVRLKENPTAREWARYKGFDVKFELPSVSESAAGNHDDTKIQSLLFPMELESQLRAIRTKANTAIEETGANILYFALGFLEWYEDDRSDVARQAPLYLIPVKIDKATLDKESGTYRYTIQYTGEDIVSNLSLREKLRFDFALELPELTEGMSPEEYFLSVEHTVLRNKPRWNIKRYGTLSMFDFGKLLMYLDLDPSRWPDGEANIKNHTIIKTFFAQQGEEVSASGFDVEYEIDQLPDVHQQYPIIDDADSSQHSALVDGIKGHNLVIEGPPGSGKSQTITNLIAAAISQGKKVLFVAEKMAALEVVKKRLERAQLGDFCLELHSHKTQKSHVYKNLDQRLAMQDSFRYPHQIDMDIAMYEEKKQELTDYAELVNSEWKKTGRTIHQIFSKATRYRDEFAHVPLSDIAPGNIEGECYDELASRRVVDELKRYADVFEQIRKQIGLDASIEQHPWFGVYNISIQHFDCESLNAKLSEWQLILRELANSLSDFNRCLGSDVVKELEGIGLLRTVKEELPELAGDENFAAIAQLTEELQDQLGRFVTHFEKASTEFTALKPHLDVALLSEEKVVKTAEAALTEVKVRLCGQQVKLREAFKVYELLNGLVEQFELISKSREVIIEQVPSLEPFIPLTINGIELLRGFLQHVVDLEPSLADRRKVCFDDDRLDTHLKILKEKLAQVELLTEKLGGVFELSALPPSKELKKVEQHLEVGGLFRWFNRDWKQSKSVVLGLATATKPKLKLLTPRLAYVVEYAELVEKIQSQAEYSELLGEEFKGIETNIQQIQSLRDWYRAVRENYGIGFGKTVKLAELLFSLPLDIVKGLRHFAETSVIPAVNVCKAKSEKLSSFSFSIFREHDAPIFDELNGIKVQSETYRDAVELCQKFANEDISTDELCIYISRAKVLIAEKGKLDDLAELLQSVFSVEELPQIAFNHGHQLARLKATHNVAVQLSTLSNQAIAQVLKQCLSQPLLEEVHKNIHKISDLYEQQQQIKQTFSSAVDLDEQAWLLSSDSTLTGLIERNERAIQQPDWLSTWADFIRVRGSLTDKGLEKLLRATEKRQIVLDELEGIYNYAVFDSLSREIIIENRKLSHFSGANQNAIRQQFAEYDNKLKLLQQERIAYQASRVELINGVSSGKVAGYTEMGLIRNEVNKKTRHVPIRQLVARAGKSLQELKPCFMMGPHSVAQYLEPGKIGFDMVVMDEASQIKPQDALGTIARGKQIIVVGDPKQLPPTSFFDKTIDNDEQDATAIELSESILDVSMPMFKARRLRWHYRSRHESLIAFSNQEFYDSNLIIFPSPNSESDEFGIKFEYVSRGRFVNQRNVEEALIVAHAVRRHMLHREHESLGVVAMSAQQREQIERCVEELSKEDELFRTALEKNTFTTEPLFIKNLENVQGDERDVIYISCTYGPQEAGVSQMPQRFGPINSAAGGRRLNVLFTRSKKRMHVFSSMTEGHILAKDNSNPGVHALKKFLAFAQSNNLYQPSASGRAPDSDFEISIASALKREGFNCVPQVGVAGYFIDLAVLDPGMPGQYLMGIECDGATYHSAKSARDRDRLRQCVLEQLGWKIRRIWSTDWFKNPLAQLKPIIEELHRLKTEGKPTDETVSEDFEIQQIIAAEDQVVEASDAYSHIDGTLKEKLKRFGELVVDNNMRDIPEDGKLLRPAMIDALVEFRPVSKSEFQEFIPGYLRNHTHSMQGKFLEQVLNIIAEDESESEAF